MTNIYLFKLKVESVLTNICKFISRCVFCKANGWVISLTLGNVGIKKQSFFNLGLGWIWKTSQRILNVPHFLKRYLGHRTFFFFNKGTCYKECSLRNCIMLRQSEHGLEKNFKLGTFQKGVGLLSARHCECSGSNSWQTVKSQPIPWVISQFL